MFDNPLIDILSIVVFAVVAAIVFWFWIGKRLWAWNRVWKAIRSYDKFGLRYQEPVLVGEHDGILVKVHTYESAIDVYMSHEPEMRLNPNYTQDDGIELGEEMYFRFDDHVLDDYFTFRSAIPEVRDRMLGNQRALDELRGVVQALGEDVQNLAFHMGIFRLTLHGALRKGDLTCLHTDQLDTWIPRLVKLARAFDEIDGIGDEVDVRSRHWPS